MFWNAKAGWACFFSGEALLLHWDWWIICVGWGVVIVPLRMMQRHFWARCTRPKHERCCRDDRLTMNFLVILWWQVGGQWDYLGRSVNVMGQLTVLTGILGKSDCISIAYSIQQYQKYSNLSLVNPRFLIYAKKQIKRKGRTRHRLHSLPFAGTTNELTMVAHRPCW